MSLDGAIKRFSTLQKKLEAVPNKIASEVEKEKKVLLQLKKDILLLGRDDNDEPLYPSYLEDPYFSTPEKARAYSIYKSRISSGNKSLITYLGGEPQKARDTPDLFITGYWTYDPAIITTSNSKFEIKNINSKGREIWSKYRIGSGISPVARDYFYQNYLLPTLIKHIYGK